MDKFVFFCAVQSDGIGDFSHLLTILKALKESDEIKNYDLIPVITCYWGESSFKKQLNDIGIYTYFIERDSDKFLKDPDLISILKEAKQFILVSYCYFRNLDQYLSMNPEAPFKYIGEHEVGIDLPLTEAESSKDKTVFRYPLGLSRDSYGIKLDKIDQLQPQAATDIIQKEERELTDALFHQTDSKGFDSFHQHNILIPAYFNKINHLVRFLNLLSNVNLPENNKNIVIFLSGKLGKDFDFDFKQIMKETSHDFIKYKNSQIKEIRLIEKKESQQISQYNFDPTYKKNLFIFYKFPLNNRAYHALYQQAILAGVSGDNTFELSAGLALPFYISTTGGSKTETVKALINIIKEMDFPASIKSSFETYFLYTMGKDIDLTSLDIKSMTKNWHFVANHLKTNYNFYDRLEEIVLSNRQVKLKALSEHKHALLTTAQCRSSLFSKKPKIPTINDSFPFLFLLAGQPAFCLFSLYISIGMLAKSKFSEKNGKKLNIK